MQITKSVKFPRLSPERNKKSLSTPSTPNSALKRRVL